MKADVAPSTASEVGDVAHAMTEDFVAIVMTHISSDTGHGYCSHSRDVVRRLAGEGAVRAMVVIEGFPFGESLR